jgi:hypothetical protein
MVDHNFLLCAHVLIHFQAWEFFIKSNHIREENRSEMSVQSSLLFGGMYTLSCDSGYCGYSVLADER